MIVFNFVDFFCQQLLTVCEIGSSGSLFCLQLTNDESLMVIMPRNGETMKIKLTDGYDPMSVKITEIPSDSVDKREIGRIRTVPCPVADGTVNGTYSLPSSTGVGEGGKS